MRDDFKRSETLEDMALDIEDILKICSKGLRVRSAGAAGCVPRSEAGVKLSK